MGETPLKVLFVHKNFFSEPLGILYLSAALKAAGHETDFFDVGLEDGVEDYVARTRPGIIGYSINTGSHHHLLEVNRKLKAVHDFTAVFGGPHPTYHPECVEEEGVDAICRGEAEGALVDFVDRLAAGEDVTAVANFWVRRDGRVHRNDVRPLDEDLDALPFPDRGLLDRYPQYRRLGARRLITARGCPFNCTYCYNKALGELYRGKGRKLRRRSPANVMEEIRELFDRYPTRILHMSDDTFVIDKGWLAEFTGLYEPVAVPFTCYARAEFLTPPVARFLRRMRCCGVHVGVESANDEIRRTYLNRRMDNALIERVASTLREEEIPLVTQNMVGLPGEDLDGAMNTLRFNARLRPAFAAVSIFQPYPGTELTRMARDMGLLEDTDEKFPFFFFDNRSLLKLDHAERFENLAELFAIGVEYPPLIPLLERLIRWRPNPLYRAAAWAFKTFIFFCRLEYVRVADVLTWAGRKTGRL